jgi:hypothetical protein
MKTEGPALESMLRRVMETPQDFLAEPRLGSSAGVGVAAVVGDLWRLLSHRPGPEVLALGGARGGSGDRNRLAVILLLCWLLADESFRSRPPSPEDLRTLLGEGAEELAAQVTAAKFISDPHRRDELVRFSLARVGLRPRGESVAQAQDRLTSLSSVERARVMKASRAAEQRAREIREALARKAAEESADKWTRE